MTPARCQAHDRVAGWRCDTCHEALCPDCAAEKTVHPAVITACTRCGGMAQTLTVHRREVAPLEARIPGAFRWPFKSDGFVTWAALVMLVTIFGSGGAFIWVPGALAALFAVVRSTARGEEDMETPSFTSLFDLVLPVARLVLAMLPFWGPLLVYVLVVGPAQVRPGPLWALGLAGAAFVPQALLVAAVGAPVLTLLNPIAIVGTALKLGRAYAVYLTTSAALLVLGLVLGALGLVFGFVPVPIFPRVVEAAFLFYAPLVSARVAGLVLFVEGDRLHWDVPERYREPVLGQTRPRGVLPAEDRPPDVAPRSYAPIEVEGVTVPDRPRSRFEALEMPGLAVGASSGSAGGGAVDLASQGAAFPADLSSPGEALELASRGAALPADRSSPGEALELAARRAEFASGHSSPGEALDLASQGAAFPSEFSSSGQALDLAPGESSFSPGAPSIDPAPPFGGEVAFDFQPERPHVVVPERERLAPRVLDAASLPAFTPPPEGEFPDLEEAHASAAVALDAQSLPSLGAQQLAEARHLIRSGDGAGALTLWREVPGLALAAGELAWLARSAGARGENDAAHTLFEQAAAAAPTGPERARALVLLGRFRAERLGHASARECMEAAVREAPDSEAARFAETWLARAG